VISIVITLVGVIALSTRIAQYPEIAPPTIKSTNYPGANARLYQTVATCPTTGQWR
jgi:multidrug efflux pump subunit AcrB